MSSRAVHFWMVAAAVSLKLRKDAPGAVRGGEVARGPGGSSGSTPVGSPDVTYAPSAVGAGTYSEAGSVAASSADRAAGMISSLMANSGAAGSSTPEASVAGSAGDAANDDRIKDIERDLIAGAEAFDKSASVGETPEQRELHDAVKAALVSSPTKLGSYPVAGASAGAASFLRAVDGKLSLTKMASIATSVAKAAEAHVTSGRANAQCDQSCQPNFSTCPQGWEARRDGSCTHPSSYTGYCNKPLRPADFAAAALEEFEVYCSVCFPCSA
ncbi:unnamed protein product [Amoebophrya sp. A120]|nr:unnamed protein product [Amoebophrya sp. A120]|eukprot:GSA120T00022944001.1